MNAEGRRAHSRSRREAVIWFDRLANPDPDPDMRDRWVEWYDVAENRAKLDRLLIVQEKLNRLSPQALSRISGRVNGSVARDSNSSMRSDALPIVPAELAAHPAPDRVSRRLHRWVAAGATALAACVAWLVLVMLLGNTIETSTGEWRRTTLSDGTVVLVAPKARLEIRFDADQRIVRLKRGEVMFTVAHDPRRPFIVDTDVGSARAVGTSFGAAWVDSGVLVTVEEGVVEVATNASEDRQTNIRKTVLLKAREQASLSRDHELVVRSVDARELLRRAVNGSFTVNDVPVATIVEEFNRRNELQIQMVDDAVAKLRISGRFDIAEPKIFAKMLAQHGAVDVVVGGRTERVNPSIVPRDSNLETKSQ